MWLIGDHGGCPVKPAKLQSPESLKSPMVTWNPDSSIGDKIIESDVDDVSVSFQSMRVDFKSCY